MTRSLRRILPALALLAACTSVHAAPRNFVFKVTGPRGALYLAGSVHLLSAEFYPLDPVFDTAFNASGTLVEELDMGEMLAPESQMRMLQRGMLPAGRTLDAVVTPETLRLVERALADLGLPVAPLKQFKPWMIAITLQSLAWQKAGFNADLGLDKHFYDRAKAAGKKVVGLETMEFQISRFDEMSPALQDQMLRETVKEIGTTKDSFGKMAAAWKAGDIEGLEELVLDDVQSEPEMYKRLLVDRNNTWLPKIEALVGVEPAFVVVGAAHLLGPDGLIALLKAKGYTVEQL